MRIPYELQTTSSRSDGWCDDRPFRNSAEDGGGLAVSRW